MGSPFLSVMMGVRALVRVALARVWRNARATRIPGKTLRVLLSIFLPALGIARVYLTKHTRRNIWAAGKPEFRRVRPSTHLRALDQGRGLPLITTF